MQESCQILQGGDLRLIWALLFWGLLMGLGLFIYAYAYLSPKRKEQYFRQIASQLNLEIKYLKQYRPWFWRLGQSRVLFEAQGRIQDQPVRFSYKSICTKAGVCGFWQILVDCENEKAGSVGIKRCTFVEQVRKVFSRSFVSSGDHFFDRCVFVQAEDRQFVDFFLIDEVKERLLYLFKALEADGVLRVGPESVLYEWLVWGQDAKDLRVCEKVTDLLCKLARAVELYNSP